jgi:hypothetical protein
MIDIKTATKEDLRDWALAELNITVDMRKSVETLRVDLAKASKPKKVEEDVRSNPAFLLNKETGFWFPCTDLLLARGDLLPCDENGNEMP